MINHLKIAFDDAKKVLDQFISNSDNIEFVDNLANSIAIAFKANKKVLICGNGGSACDAMHFAEEFTGRYRKNRKALPVISLNDPAHITCVGNDFGLKKYFPDPLKHSVRKMIF